MNLTATKITTRGIISLILTITMVISITFGLSLNASAAEKVTIKTQAKADSLVQSGAIKGIDVSKWQGTIDWKKVAADKNNIKFAFIRADYGAEPDAFFVENMKGANANGIKAGAYHYSRFKDTESVDAEAKAFIAQLKKVDVTYPVVLDVENHYGLSKNELTELCLSFIKKIEAQGYNVMIYTYENFYKGHLNGSKLTEVPLWIANYKEYPSSINHKVWQHTSYALVSGISTRVDVNIAYKDLAPAKPIQVDGTISKNITTFLNETLGSDMAVDKVDMDSLHYWLSMGIQRDLARDFDREIQETGKLNKSDVDLFVTLTGKDICNNNIMRYIQARLFYKGFYTNELTGSFDDHTVEAVKNYQRSIGVVDSGSLGRTTMSKLFNVSDTGETTTATSSTATSSVATSTPAKAESIAASPESTTSSDSGTKVASGSTGGSITGGNAKSSSSDSDTLDGDFN